MGEEDRTINNSNKISFKNFFDLELVSKNTKTENKIKMTFYRRLKINITYLMIFCMRRCIFRTNFRKVTLHKPTKRLMRKLLKTTKIDCKLCFLIL